MKVKDIVNAIEEFAPPALQEGWDNSGLLVGNSADKVNSAVITLDVTEAIVDDAIKNDDDIIIAHHPLIFGGLKRLNGKTDTERAVMKAIKNDIAIYAAHTSIDVVQNGVSWRMAKKLGIKNLKTLAPQKGLLKKMVTYVPEQDGVKVREAIFKAGAGTIGEYDSCSYNINGQGTFRAGENTNPHVGEIGKMHFEKETRIETVFPAFLQGNVVSALLNAHPYEEVAYDIYPLENKHPQIGLGVIGDLPTETDAKKFLTQLKDTFGSKTIRHTAIHKPNISKIALLGGSGSTYLNTAIGLGADVFVTADFKYHQFFDAENKIIIADIGHYESEQFTKELFYEIVTNKFSKFAVRFSDVNTNPINYLF